MISLIHVSTELTAVTGITDFVNMVWYIPLENAFWWTKSMGHYKHTDILNHACNLINRMFSS